MPRATAAIFAIAAALLLLATWAWHLPLMLWDHLDLVPMYDAWRTGRPLASQLWGVHDGSHFHGAAYLVLLATTHLSGGQPWLDCVVSWALLLVQAAILLSIAMRTLKPVRSHRGWQCVMVFLVLYPGHLANLQWGWQVAVFICLLFGAVLPVHLITRSRLTPARSVVAAASAAVGVAGFSSALAMFPVAIGLIALRPDIGGRQRVMCIAPWLVVLAALVVGLRSAHATTPAFSVVEVSLYSLNYIGAGVLRFAEGLAAPWAALGIVTACVAAVRVWRQPAAWPWIALVAFALGCAVLTGMGRAAGFGADHAFVTRYVSFSSLFWTGWLGLVLLAFHRQRGWSSGLRWVAMASVVFAVVNGVHLVRKARSLHERSVQYAAHIAARHPAPAPDVLERAYGDRARFAADRLRVLHRYGFAPFDRGTVGDVQPRSR